MKKEIDAKGLACPRPVILTKKELDGILASGAERVAIVCHGGTIRVMICGLLGLPMQKRFYIGNPPVNCAITILQQANEEWFLHVFNDYSHTANL